MMKEFYVKAIFLFSIVLLSVIFTSTLKAEPIVIRFSHVVSEDTPKGIGAKIFKKLVEERFPGKVSVIIYPKSEKFTDSQALLSLLFGDIEMAAPSFTKLCKFNKSLRIFDFPFLFENVEEVHRFQNSPTGQRLLSSIENCGLKGLAYWDNGMRIISANKEIVTPDDLNGLTFRIEPSQVFYYQYSKLGAVPISMPFKRIPDALQTGIVDGHENTWSNIRASNLHLLRPNFTEIAHSYLGYMVVTSVTFWEKLPAEMQTEISKILAEVTIEVNRLASEKNKVDRQVVMNNPKANIVSLTESEKQVWKDSLISMWDEFKSDVGNDILQTAQSGKEVL